MRNPPMQGMSGMPNQRFNYTGPNYNQNMAPQYPTQPNIRSVLRHSVDNKGVGGRMNTGQFPGPRPNQTGWGFPRPNMPNNMPNTVRKLNS